jgi:DNA invertase Pin-like site-specific DNA recombinase
MNDPLGYVRVSSEEQADSGLGLEAQRQRIAAYCAMKGLRLAEVFEDPGWRGGWWRGQARSAPEFRLA